MNVETLYIDQFTDYHTYVKIGEYTVPLPAPPPDEQIINFGLPIDEQIISKTTYNINGSLIPAYKITKAIWNKLSEDQQTEIKTTEWNRRINGCWYFNGGRKIFVPPNQYFFINYWTFPNGSKPEWWDSQWFSFLLADWAFHHPKALGRAKVKGRRGGGSAEENCNCFHYTTLYKGSMSGMMNKNEKEAKRINFSKIVHAMLSMPYFFQPKRSGENRPATEILFSAPSSKITVNSEKEDEEKYQADEYLNSYINFIATSEVGYDGELMTWITVDELFKWKDVSPISAIEIQSLCIKDGGEKNSVVFNGRRIYKGLMSCLSSVEEISDDQLEEVRKLWESSDPKTETETEISASSVIRYFEPFYFGFKGFMNKHGYSLVEKCIEVHRKIEANIKKKKGGKAAIDWRRKFPETLDHALLPSVTKSAFNIDVLNRAEQNYHNLLPDDKKPIMGMLVWIEKFVSVKFVPAPDEKEFGHSARWEISHIPDDKYRNAVGMHSSGNRMPLNRGKFTMATDPIDHDVAETSEGSKLSNGACWVKREFDALIDGDKFDENGEPLNEGYGFKTNRTVCIYCYRPDSADEFFEDMAKTAIFFGCPNMMEASSRGMKKFFIDNKMALFLLNNDGQTINYNNKDNIGWKASKEAKQQQFEAMDNYINKFGLAERHLTAIKDLKVTNKANLTHHDVTSAGTICEITSSNLFYKKYEPNKEKPVKKDVIHVRKRVIQPGKTKTSFIH